MQTKWGRAAYSVANAPGGDAPKMGLLIGLHGGGPGAGDKSEAQGVWSAPLAKQNLVGIFPQAIQLVHDAWDTPEGNDSWYRSSRWPSAPTTSIPIA